MSSATQEQWLIYSLQHTLATYASDNASLRSTVQVLVDQKDELHRENYLLKKRCEEAVRLREQLLRDPSHMQVDEALSKMEKRVGDIEFALSRFGTNPAPKDVMKRLESMIEKEIVMAAKLKSKERENRLLAAATNQLGEAISTLEAKLADVEHQTVTPMVKSLEKANAQIKRHEKGLKAKDRENGKLRAELELCNSANAGLTRELKRFERLNKEAIDLIRKKNAQLEGLKQCEATIMEMKEEIRVKATLVRDNTIMVEEGITRFHQMCMHVINSMADGMVKGETSNMEGIRVVLMGKGGNIPPNVQDLLQMYDTMSESTKKVLLFSVLQRQKKTLECFRECEEVARNGFSIGRESVMKVLKNHHEGLHRQLEAFLKLYEKEYMIHATVTTQKALEPLMERIGSL